MKLKMKLDLVMNRAESQRMWDVGGTRLQDGSQKWNY